MNLRFPFIPIVFIAFLVALAYFDRAPKSYQESLIERVETTGGPIIVFERDGLHLMTFNEENWNFVESMSDPKDPSALPADYARYLTLPLLYAKEQKRILMIGMGGGVTTTYLNHHMPSADITAVEIDPAVAEMAKKYFGFKESARYRAVIADGLDYMRTQTVPYDIVLLDAFSGGFIPAHLASADFYKEVAAHLSEGGAVGQNIEAVKNPPENIITAMGEAFEHVDAYAVRSNFVLVGYNGAKQTPESLRARATKIQKAYNLRYPLEDFLYTRKAVK